MAIYWRLKKYLLNEHHINTATDFKKLIKNKTGIIISLPNVCAYVNGRPRTIKLDVAELFCTTLTCELSDFLEITPSKARKQKEGKLSYQTTPHSKRGLDNFPDPMDYKK